MSDGHRRSTISRAPFCSLVCHWIARMPKGMHNVEPLSVKKKKEAYMLTKNATCIRRILSSGSFVFSCSRTISSFVKVGVLLPQPIVPIQAGVHVYNNISIMQPEEGMYYHSKQSQTQLSPRIREVHGLHDVPTRSK